MFHTTDAFVTAKVFDAARGFDAAVSTLPTCAVADIVMRVAALEHADDVQFTTQRVVDTGTTYHVSRKKSKVSAPVNQEDGDILHGHVSFRPSVFPAPASLRDIYCGSRYATFRDFLSAREQLGINSCWDPEQLCRSKLADFMTYDNRAISSSPAELSIILGGTGALGLRVGRWCHDESAFNDARTLLVGRSGRGQKWGQIVNSVRAEGKGVTTTVKCNTSVADNVTALENAVADGNFGSNTIKRCFAAAGVLSDASILNTTAGGIFVAHAPKVHSSRTVSRILLSSSVAARVAFSSVASQIGSAGQAAYAAANAATDAIDLRDRCGGIPVIIIRWGAWRDAGMAAKDPAVLARIGRSGIGTMTPKDGIATLEAALVLLSSSNSRTIIVASPFIWHIFARNVRRVPSCCKAVCENTKYMDSASMRRMTIGITDIIADKSNKMHHLGYKSVPNPFPQETIRTSAAHSEREIRDYITRVVVDLTGNESVLPHDPLMTAGLDSLAGSDLSSTINATFDLNLPAAAVYDYPTITALTSYVFDAIGREDRSTVSFPEQRGYHSVLPARLPFEALLGRVIIITGASARAPSRAKQPAVPAYGDCVERVPRALWDMQAYQDEAQKCLPNLGGFMEGADEFDADLFKTSQTEAVLMDPQHRQLLEMLFHARSAEDCTLSTRDDDLRGCGFDSAGCGAFVGIADQSYQHAHIMRFWRHGSDGLEPTHPYIATGNTLSCAAGRLCFVFGMHGPALSVDTACSSSIVSTHIAACEIWDGEIHCAVACGAHSITAHNATATFHAAGMLSPDCRCKTMDASADGYVRGESIGVLVLEASLSKATHKIPTMNQSPKLVSTAVNQDGRSSGLTAPSGLAQQAVIRAALKAGALVPSNMQTLQMHGTGTSLGDPIEFGASIAVLRTHEDCPLVLEAVKSFIGHTECASGVIGMMQPLENLSAANTEKVLHLTTINPHVISVMKSTTSIDIKSPVVRLGRQVAGNSLAACSGDAVCGVGSFAFQGTNGHAVFSAEIKASGGSRAVPGVRTIFHLFNKFRHWVLPASHASLRSFDAFRKMARQCLRADLDPRVLDHLWDHRVGGRALFPAAGFLELAIAGTTMSLAMGVDLSGSNVAMIGCTVPTPMILSDPNTTRQPFTNPVPSRRQRGSGSHFESSYGRLMWCMENGSSMLEIGSSTVRTAVSKRLSHAHARMRVSLSMKLSSVPSSMLHVL